MPFDISTAKPASSGFDLNSAKPFQQQEVEAFVNEDVPQEFGGGEFEQSLKQENKQRESLPQPTLTDEIIGAGDTALTLLSGSTTGAAGFLGGTVEGILKGLPPKEAQKLAEQRASSLTISPKTEVGQRNVSEISQALSVLPPASGITAIKPLIHGKNVSEQSLRTPRARKQLLIDEIRSGNPNIETVTKALDSDGKLITRPASKKALKVLGGGDAEKRTISLLENSNAATKKQVDNMLNDIVKGNKNAVFKNENRPSDRLGESILSRARAVTKQNEMAGKRIGGVAERLKDTNVDISAPRNEFISSLSDLGVTFKTGKDGWVAPDFSRSKFIGGNQKDMTVLINELLNTSPDFSTAHKLKRTIRDNVDFDKGGTGQIKGQSERLLKDLSREIDGILDDTSPEYKKANERFAKTIKLKEDFDALAGKDIDISNDIAAKSLGAKGMRLVSNAESRVKIQQTLNNADKTLGELGVRFKDDLPTLVHMTAELNNIFKLAPSGSLKGNVIDAGLDAIQASTSPVEAARAGLRKVNELRAPDFNKKIRALKALTNTQGKK